MNMDTNVSNISDIAPNPVISRPNKDCNCPKDHTPLGNITNYSANAKNQQVTRPEKEVELLKHRYKKSKIELKKKIGKKIPRVGGCGINPIARSKYFEIVKGVKGGIYYHGMQRCGSIWFCPDCMYKLMKTRSEELYNQLSKYNDQGKTVLFVTFTIQHNKSDRLGLLRQTLIDAFGYANSHRRWKEIKKTISVEFLRALEVVFGENGWHPHLHCLFVGSPEIIEALKVFQELYESYLKKQGLLVNKHTVITKPWNGMADSLSDYMFKDTIEHEITGGNLQKSGKGKTFFELVEEGNEPAVNEYIKEMKGKRQYHRSKGFFQDIKVKTHDEVLRDDKVDTVLFTIHKDVYADMRSKGIALHFINEYNYGGYARAMKLMDLYDCDSSFMGRPPP